MNTINIIRENLYEYLLPYHSLSLSLSLMPPYMYMHRIYWLLQYYEVSWDLTNDHRFEFNEIYAIWSENRYRVSKLCVLTYRFKEQHKSKRGLWLRMNMYITIIHNNHNIAIYSNDSLESIYSKGKRIKKRMYTKCSTHIEHSFGGYYSRHSEINRYVYTYEYIYIKSKR